MRQGSGGNMIVISSIHAVQAFPTSMAYNMAKAAVDQMARTAALELVRYGIRVNIVYPGWTDTLGERKYFSEDVLRRAAPRCPWADWPDPKKSHAPCYFLLIRLPNTSPGARCPWMAERNCRTGRNAARASCEGRCFN